MLSGAGNLISPVQMGREAGSNTSLAAIGFLLAATGLPVLGVIASTKSVAREVRERAARIDTRLADAFTCLLYLTIGPALAISRTTAVSSEIDLAESVLDGARTWVMLAFSAAFFGITAAARRLGAALAATDHRRDGQERLVDAVCEESCPGSVNGFGWFAPRLVGWVLGIVVDQATTARTT